MTPREEERQPMSSSCWPRCCTPPLLESTGFSFTEFSYSFTFSCSLLLLLSPFLALHHQVALPQHQEGREGEQPCVNQVPGPWPGPQGCSRSCVICFPSRGGQDITSAMCSNSTGPRLGMSPAEVRASGGRAKDALRVIPFLLDPLFPKH